MQDKKLMDFYTKISHMAKLCGDDVKYPNFLPNLLNALKDDFVVELTKYHLKTKNGLVFKAAKPI